MRLATYSQRTVPTNASLIAYALLSMTIILGSTGLITSIMYFNPALSPVATLIWFTLYVVAIAGLMFVHGISWIFWLSRYRFLLVILLFGCAISVAWSLDPDITIQRTVHLLGSSIIAIYLGFMIPLSSLLNVLAGILAMLMVMSLGSIFVFPELGIENYSGDQVWRGMFASKNTLGFWSAVGVLLYISQMSKPISLLLKAVYFSLAVLCLFTLYKTDSATSQLALIVSGALCLYFFIAIRFHLGFIRMAVMAVLLASLAAIALFNISTSELIGRSGDLTGRGEVWEQVWKLILQKPLTGYGYGSIWNPTDATLWMQQSLTDFSWVVYHAHNGFLQVASEIGLPLSCIALLMVVQQLIEIFYCQYDRQQVGVLFVLGFVTAYLISNYSEARFLINRDLTWILFLTLPISMLRQVNLVLAEDTDSDTDDPSVTGDESHYVNAVSATTSSTAALSSDGHPADRSIEHDDLDALFEEDERIDPMLSATSMSVDSVKKKQALDTDDRFDKLLDENYSDQSISDVDIFLDGSTEKKEQ